MQESSWQKRISRAKTLAHQYPFASEILNFYCAIAGFQQSLFQRIEGAASSSNGATRELGIKSSSSVIPSEAELPHSGDDSAQSGDPVLPIPGRAARSEAGRRRNSAEVADNAIVAGPPELSTLLASFPQFLTLVEKHGPSNLAEAARHLRAAPSNTQTQLLNDFWDARSTSSDVSEIERHTTNKSPSNEFFARAFLQPYAEFLRMRAEISSNGHAVSLCPFCGRKPGLAVLRPLGDGGQRRLVCSFCLAEWEFRRIICASCGEEDHKNLPVYTSDQFPHVRVDCCDRCRRYLKTIDLTKTGLAEPIVDELATIPLDLWARERGYEKLELNLLQL